MKSLKAHKTPLIVHVVGARPNFPKAAPVYRALSAMGIRQFLIHTGQHYDDTMSASFFRDLDLPKPDINLGIGPGSHSNQTARTMVGLERSIEIQSPDLLVVYGDVNSTLAAALVAAKMGIPVAHVEAGLRSFDRAMPEEINRILTDHISEILFTPSVEASENLIREGAPKNRIHFVGNTMIDSLKAIQPAIDSIHVREEFGVPSEFILATMHRPSNVDSPSTASEISQVLVSISEQCPVVFPMHPRGRPQFEHTGLFEHPNILVLDPLPYTKFIALVRAARAVITDSGGVQEETTYLGIPCLTLRSTTERPATITHGTNELVTPQTLRRAVDAVLHSPKPEHRLPPLWDGDSGSRIAKVIVNWVRDSAENETCSSKSD